MIRLFSCCFLCLACLPCFAEEYRQVPLALHVQSSWSSDGVMTVDQIAEKARERGIRAVILNDHDIMKCEYGIPLLRRIFKKTVEYPSVLKNGPSKYLDEIRQANEKYPDVLLIPGVEATPYYFWSGSPWSRDLTLNDWHKHMLVAGLDDPDDYQRLPVLGNEAAAGKTSLLLFWPLLLCASPLVMKNKRTLAKLLFYAGALGAFINFPFKTLPFDQYDGKRSEAPYQDLIDYVGKASSDTGMVFWAHPEAPDFAVPQKMNGVLLSTPKYPEALMATSGYTGFGYFQEGDETVGAPGGVWDRILTDFVNGKRPVPVWAVGELDYRSEGHLGTYMDSFKNTVLLPSSGTVSPSAISRAVKAGRFYITAKPQTGCELMMTDFSISAGSSSAVSGENIRANVNARLTLKLDTPGARREKIRISVIQEGNIIESIDSSSPVDISLSVPQPAKKTYYRIEARAPNGARLVTNPVFVE